MAACARERVFGAGQIIVRQGEAGDSMFLIGAGEARVTLEPSGQEVARLGAGTYLGEMSMLTGDPRSATVSAVTDCVLYRNHGRGVPPDRDRAPGRRGTACRQPSSRAGPGWNARASRPPHRRAQARRRVRSSPASSSSCGSEPPVEPDRTPPDAARRDQSSAALDCRANQATREAPEALVVCLVRIGRQVRRRTCMCWRGLVLLCVLTVAAAVPADTTSGDSAQAPPAPATGLLVKGGDLIDGAGSPARRADVRTSRDTVAEIGPSLRPQAGERVIAVAGRVIAPGFIDIHTHVDQDCAEERPEAEDQCAGRGSRTSRGRTVRATAVSPSLELPSKAIRTTSQPRSQPHRAAASRGPTASAASATLAIAEGELRVCCAWPSPPPMTSAELMPKAMADRAMQQIRRGRRTV